MKKYNGCNINHERQDRIKERNLNYFRIYFREDENEKNSFKNSGTPMVDEKNESSIISIANDSDKVSSTLFSREDLEVFTILEAGRAAFEDDKIAYFSLLAIQFLPLILQWKYATFVYFLGTAALVVYLGSKRHAEIDKLGLSFTEAISLKKAILAPIIAGFSIAVLYFCISFLHLQISSIYQFLSTIFAAIAAKDFFAALVLPKDYKEIQNLVMKLPSSTLTTNEISQEVTENDDLHKEEISSFAPMKESPKYQIDEKIVSTLNKAQVVGYCGAGLFSSMYLFGGFFDGFGNNASLFGGNLVVCTLGITAISAIPISSYLAGACFLMGLFFYDSIAVFGTKAMITVATKIDGPIKLLFPNQNPSAEYPYSILGLGDLVIPGLFVALLGLVDQYTNINETLIDKEKQKRISYLQSGVLAYSFGLICTFLANIFTNAGQPALFYLSPILILSSLGTAFVNEFILGHEEELSRLIQFQNNKEQNKTIE